MTDICHRKKKNISEAKLSKTSSERKTGSS
jgi:hypothetical protein